MKYFLSIARRFKTATLLNLLGLIVAFTTFYLLMTQVDYSRSYNTGITDSHRIYRVEISGIFASQWGTNICRPIAEMIETMPEVESMSLLQEGSPITVKAANVELKSPCVQGNNHMLKTFAPRLLSGQLDFSDDDKDGVLLPASLAMKLFGRVDVAGEMVQPMLFGKETHVRIRGVYEDFPANCDFPNAGYLNYYDENKDAFNNYNYDCYVKLKENVNADELLGENFSDKVTKIIFQQLLSSASPEELASISEEEMNQQFEQAFGKMRFRLVPISETYFSGVNANHDKGNPGMYFILQLACILIIIVASINFLNFTLAESPARFKNVNTRRILGETTSRLRFELIAESICVSLFACAVSFFFIWLISLSPEAQQLLAGNISLSHHPGIIGIMLLLSVAVGIAAGTYPAFFVTSFQPVLALKGSFGLSPRGRQLRTALICLQFIISFLLVVYISILYLQSHYIYNSDYGFDKDEVAYVDVRSLLSGKKETIRSELLRQTGIEDVSYSSAALGTSDTYMTWGRSDADHQINFVCMFVDYHYLNTMGIQLKEGRDFNEHDEGCYIINEAAHQAWPWVKLDQKILAKEDEFPIVGYCENVRFGSTRLDRNSEPLAFFIPGGMYNQWDNLYVLNIRIAAGVNKKEMRQKIHDIIMNIDGTTEVEVKFLDQQLEDLYQEEFRFIRQVLAFSFICLLITLIGVFCLTMFETEYRRKEIGIRKILGSSEREVLQLLCRRYAILLLISFIVAAPVAWYIGNEWLQNFADRTPIYWWIFPLSFFLVSFVVLLTVIIQTWSVATMNPIESIRTE